METVLFQYIYRGYCIVQALVWVMTNFYGIVNVGKEALTSTFFFLVMGLVLQAVFRGINSLVFFASLHHRAILFVVVCFFWICYEANYQLPVPSRSIRCVLVQFTSHARMRLVSRHRACNLKTFRRRGLVNTLLIAWVPEVTYMATSTFLIGWQALSVRYWPNF